MCRPLVLSLALLTVALLAWPNAAQSVRALGDGEAADTDGDFLLDCIEWAVLTNSSQPDSDGDQISDFVEVVQRGAPRRAGHPMPADQELRLVVTGPEAGSGSTTAHLHLLMRILGPISAITSFDTWIELPAAPGMRFPFSFVSLGAAVLQERVTATEGLWLRVTVPLASVGALRQLAPLSIHVESTVAGRTLRNGVKLIDVFGDLSSLVPFDDKGFALQTIQPSPGGTGGQSNRVCVLGLQDVSSGGGSLFEVVSADCEDCNEVECSPACAESLGWLIDLPGGLSTLTSH
jgi:hypothetical protein